MSARKPEVPGSQFGTAFTRTGVVHRIRRTGRLQAIWLCGGMATLAVPVDDPAEVGHICRQCEALFYGCTVYRCYNAAGELLYIGSCNLWKARVSLHKKETRWWSEVARVTQEPQPDLATAKRAEMAAIADEAPLYNKVYNVKRWRRSGTGFVPVEAAA